MKLNLEGILEGSEAFLQKGYRLPRFDVAELRKKTSKDPAWLHFGAGNIFRIFPARLLGRLIEEGHFDRGIIVCESFDEEIVDKAFRPFDDLTLAVTLKGEGTVEKEVVATVCESLKLSDGYNRLREIFISPGLMMVTLTITEKGYALRQGGEILPRLGSDFCSMDNPKSMPAILAKLLHERYMAGAAPIALVSLDNCSHNGSLLKEAVLDIASSWRELGIVDSPYISYLEGERVAFNWTMIDKITPRPSEVVSDLLKADGFDDPGIIVTAKNSYTAAFVNAEECEYLAIEDNFPNGRPPLEKAGVIFGGRDTVDRIEKMKVCTCLNPLHTALAIFGCLLDHISISGAMGDEVLKRLVTKLGYDEGLPVVVDPVVMSAADFLKEAIEKRFPNPFVPDTPQRIACDTSKKLPVRFGETLKAYIVRGEKDLSFLTVIPLVFAGWGRYLMGINDMGMPFNLSPDPNLEELKGYLREAVLGAPEGAREGLSALFSRDDIFGVNLYDYNLGKKCEELFFELAAGPGAVRQTLLKYL